MRATLRAGTPAPVSDVKVMTLIGTGHFLSHFYILVLPPLFPLLRGELGVSYTALGAAIAVLNVTTALTQAPVGFLVDRFGARYILITGLALFALATLLVGVFPSYPALLACMVLAGLGNSVFHPADYAILSGSVDTRRMGRAFSIHTFAGYFGTATAPVVVVSLTRLIDWQTALMICGAAGLVVALIMLANGRALQDDRRAGGEAGARRSGAGADLRLLLSTPVLLALFFFAMLSLTHGGANTYAVAALEGLYEVSLVEANVPLTVYLFLSAFGVLAGGYVADRTGRHERVVALCMSIAAVCVLSVALWTPPLAAVVALLAIAGFCSGVIAPSRDMMVRAITPKGASGKVFGFVTTGFNIGGLLLPLVYGPALDYGYPGLVFVLMAVLGLLTVLTVLPIGQRSSRRPA